MQREVQDVYSFIRSGFFKYFFILPITLVFFLLSIISPKSAIASTLGITDLSNPDGFSGLYANVINCSGFLTGANSGTITDINAYMAEVLGTSNVQYAIYAGDDNAPTNLLWASNSTPLTPADSNAWFTIATGEVEFTSNTSIWLCENSDAANGEHGNFVTIDTQGLIAEKSPYTFGSFPQTPSGWSLPNPNIQYAMYVNYTPSNVAPSVGAITVSPSPAHINEQITASANFSDSNVQDTHTAIWDWGDGNTTTGTVTEASGSGSVSNTHTYTNFGTYTITLTVKDNHNATGSNTKDITVVKQITILNPAEAWLSKGLLNIGVRFDVLAEAYKDSTLVSSGQFNSVQVGSGGFNNADLISIPFNSFSPVDFPQGSELKMKLSVRNACTGSLLNSGTARLWFNDNQANSHFGATIGTTNNSYYLLDNFLLSTTVGTGPRQNIDIQAGAKCSPFKSFGTWTITP